jgi:hypothetical protein
MAEKTLISYALALTNLAHTGYRRAGLALVKGENTIPADTITETQLAQLKADPRLKITVQEEGGSAGTDGDQSLLLDQGSVPDTLATAIALLDPANVDHFTSTGKPQIDALETLLGHKVTAAERDEAWETFLAEQEA